MTKPLLQARARAALEALRAGAAESAHLSALVAAYNFATAVVLRFRSCGDNLVAPLQAWRAALVAAAEQGGKGMAPAQLEAVETGLTLHDDLLDAVTPTEMSEVAVLVKRHVSNAMLMPAPAAGGAR